MVISIERHLPGQALRPRSGGFGDAPGGRSGEPELRSAAEPPKYAGHPSRPRLGLRFKRRVTVPKGLRA